MIPRDLLPDDMVDRAFIAGGWAACPALATDMDIWVRVTPSDGGEEVATGEDLDIVREQLLCHLRALPVFRVKAEVNLEVGEGYNADGAILTKRVAAVKRGRTVYHILVTNGTVDEVLLNFDVSAHQVAIEPTGLVVRGPNFTTVNEPPYAIRMNDKTPVRLKKITERFAKVDL